MFKDTIKENMDVTELLKDIRKKDTPKRCILFVIAVFIYALIFNVFFSKYNVVMGGTSGIAILINHIYEIDESKFILIVSTILLLFSFLLLGINITVKNLAGTFLFPFFVKITSYLVGYLNIDSSSFFLLMVYGGVLLGIANGIIMKTGFTIGGFNILYQIFNKYLKLSIGTSSIILNSIIIFLGAIIFGIPSSIYAVIALIISSYITDRILIGVSKNKTFYIITEKDKDVKEYILKKLNHGVTIFNIKGGYTNDRKKMLMCVIPTKEYYSLKEVVQEIDEDAFFLITDSYETNGAV